MNEYKENNIDTKLNDIKDLIKEKIKPIETIKIIIHVFLIILRIQKMIFKIQKVFLIMKFIKIILILN